jgi:hypothetical protein
LEEIELILLPLELPEIIQMKIYSFINSLSFLLKVMEVHKYNSNTREAKVGVSQVQGKVGLELTQKNKETKKQINKQKHCRSIFIMRCCYPTVMLDLAKLLSRA